MQLVGAHIRIEPDFPLEETARVLSEALDVSLESDDSGYFEEFPAFVGVARNTHFALLGPPSPDYIIGDPYEHYELQVLPLDPQQA
jgi:hypothetical protein